MRENRKKRDLVVSISEGSPWEKQDRGRFRWLFRYRSHLKFNLIKISNDFFNYLLNSWMNKVCFNRIDWLRFYLPPPTEKYGGLMYKSLVRLGLAENKFRKGIKSLFYRFNQMVSSPVCCNQIPFRNEIKSGLLRKSCSSLLNDQNKARCIISFNASHNSIKPIQIVEVSVMQL